MEWLKGKWVLWNFSDKHLVLRSFFLSLNNRKTIMNSWQRGFSGMYAISRRGAQLKKITGTILSLLIILDTWMVDPSLKKDIQEAVINVSPIEQSTASSFWHGRSSSSIACTVWVLNSCNFKRRWRNFCMAVQAIRISVLARRMDFPALSSHASLTLSTVSASTEGLSAPFLCKTLPVSLKIIPTSF